MSKLNLPKLEKMLGDKFAAFKKMFEVEDPEHNEVVFVKLADGSAEISGTIEVGQAVTMKAQDGTETPCADGEYKIEGGKTISVMSGAITEISDTQIEEKEEEKEESMSAEKIQELIQTSLSKQATEFNKVIEGLTKSIAELKESNKSAFQAVAESLELMVDIKAPAPEKKDDPKDKFAQKRAENFAAFLKAKENIKNKQNNN